MEPVLSAPPRHRAIIVLGLVLALAMGALEATVVSTAMPSVVGDLGGIELYAWVTTAYLLTSSVTVPLYGKLADSYGRKPILLGGLAVFLVGSAASGLARSMTQLIVFRAVQGMGAGAMQPVAQTVVGDLFDISERGRIQGVFGAAWGLFGMIGPAVGGFCVKHLSWRWVFYMNVPLGVAATVILVVALHESVQRRTHALDLAGAMLLMTGLSALLLAFSRSLAGAAVWAAPAAVGLLTAFFVAERFAAEPILPLHLFARPVMRNSSLSGAIIGGAMVAITMFVPLYVQGVLHGDPTQAGSAFTPMLIGWPLASTLGGRLIVRLGFRPLVRVGLAITAVAGLTLALFGGQHGLGVLQLITGLFGVGMGLSNTALLIAVQSSVGWEQRGIATASTLFFRTLGGALAVSALGGVLNTVLAADPAISHTTASQVLSPAGVGGLDPVQLAHVSQALSRGLGWIFWLVAAAACAAFANSLGFPHVPVPRTAARGAGRGSAGPSVGTEAGTGAGR